MANNFIRAGFVSVLGGMNNAISPSLLHDTQYVYGLNVSSRGGLLHTRPQYQRLSVYIPPGKFQGSFVYRARYRDYICVVVDGTVYLIEPTTGKRWNCATFPTTTFDRAYFCQADRFLIVQNGVVSPVENWPIILDSFMVVDNGRIQIPVDSGGVTTWPRLEDTDDWESTRVPIGTLMAYGHGRLFVVVPRIWDTGLLSGTAQWLPVERNRFFVAGDICKPDNADEVLAFTETTYLDEGGAMSLPVEAGEIRGFQFFRNAATGTGAGELVVFGEHGVSAFAVSAPRSQWNDISLAQVLFADSGATSDRAVMAVNDDLAFRAEDGLRFVRFSAATMSNSSNSLSNLPQSMEIDPILSQDDYDAQDEASMALVDNRLFLTTYGTSDDDVDNPAYYRALAPLDLYVVGATGPSSTMQARSTPAYDGAWTGLEILQVFRLPLDETREVAAVMVRMEDRLEVWYQTADVYHDGLADHTLCRVQTRSFNFDKPLEPKEFKYAEVWVSDLVGDVEFTCYWRPDDYALWTQTNVIRVAACETGAKQQRWCLRFAIPPDTRYYDQATNRDTRKGFSFEFCLEWKGIATIEKAAFYANPQPASSPNLGCAAETCIPLAASDSTGVEIDMLEYEITPLTPLIDPGEQASPIRPDGVIVWVVDNGDGTSTIYWISGSPTSEWPQVYNPETGEEYPPDEDGFADPPGNGSTASTTVPTPNTGFEHFPSGSTTSTPVPATPASGTGNPSTPSTPDSTFLLSVAATSPVPRGSLGSAVLSQRERYAIVGVDGSVTYGTRAGKSADSPATVTSEFTSDSDTDTMTPTTHDTAWDSAGQAAISLTPNGGTGASSPGTLKVTASIGGRSVVGTARVTVTAAASILQVAPQAVNISQSEGSTATPTFNLTVTNVGPAASVLGVSAAVQAGGGFGIAIVPTTFTGLTGGTSTTLACTLADTSTLLTGSYQTVIRVSGSAVGATGMFVDVTVNLVITEIACDISLSPDLHVYMLPGNTMALTGNTTLTNNSGANVDWSSTGVVPPEWAGGSIVSAPASGSGLVSSEALVVSVTPPSGVAVGEYTGTLEVNAALSADPGSTDDEEIQVIVTVAAPDLVNSFTLTGWVAGGITPPWNTSGTATMNYIGPVGGAWRWQGNLTVLSGGYSSDIRIDVNQTTGAITAQVYDGGAWKVATGTYAAGLSSGGVIKSSPNGETPGPGEAGARSFSFASGFGWSPVIVTF